MIFSLEDLNKGLRTSVAAITQLVLFGNLIDMIKLEKQRDYKSTYTQIFNKFTKQGLFRANTHGIVPGAIMYGTRGMVYGTTYTLLQRYFDITDKNSLCLVSGAAGFVEGLISSPMVLLRVRISEKVTKSTDVKFSIKQALQTSPINGMKRGSDWALRSYLFNQYKELLKLNDMSTAFIAGVSAAIMTTPLDRMLPLLQQNSPPKDITRWIKSQNFRCMYAGTSMRLLNSGMNSLYVMTAMKYIQISQY
jgi:hypothetical protein